MRSRPYGDYLRAAGMVSVTLDGDETRGALLGDGSVDPFPTVVIRFSGGPRTLERLGEALRCLEDVERFPAVADQLAAERGLENWTEQAQLSP